MTKIVRNGAILMLGDSYRIEPGPVLVEGTADKATLDNSKTAEHYQVGRADALGAMIEDGGSFSYLDWLGHGEGREGATAHYVYKLGEDERWERIGQEADEAAAIAFAATHMAKGD